MKQGMLRSVAGTAMVVLGFILSGCQQAPTLMPLEVGSSWVYESVTPLGKGIRNVEAKKAISVGAIEGSLLKSESGETHLAWKDQTLMASVLSGTHYNPPLPLMKSGTEKATWTWSGQVISPLGRQPAEATMTQEPAERTVAGLKKKMTMVTISLKAGMGQQEIVTWYADGYGVAYQEERRNKILVSKLSYVSGP